VRVWTWQAFAHGAEVVSYFRWRQAPFAQEQMHAGLNRPDRVLDQGGLEATQVGAELQALSAVTPLAGLKVAPKVALLFDYDSHWIGQIQPQGAGYSVIHECFRAYSALRGLGLDVDVLPSSANLAGYALVVLPALLNASEGLAAALAASPAQVVVGARGGSKTGQLSIPANLPPGHLAALLGVAVTRVESLPPGMVEPAAFGAQTLAMQHWRERLELRGAAAEATYADGSPALVRHGRARYLAGGLDGAGWTAVLARAAADAGLAVRPLADGLRISRLGDLAIACNFADQACDWQPDAAAQALLGGTRLEPRGVAVWRVRGP
jgi:beta-galactosidase